MVTANILQRTFRITYGDREGTCLTIDQRDRQYIVTAAHMVQGISSADTVLIFHQGSWKRLQASVIGVANSPADVAVLAAPIQLSPTHPLPAGTDGLYLSQDVYFLGFPYGMQIEVGPALNRDFPLPLVKKGIVSSMEFSSNNLDRLLLDAHNNPGFSGGPVVYVPAGTRDCKVAGIISGYRYEWSRVYAQEQATPLVMKENTGIVVVHPIGQAIKLIEANPAGFLLKSSDRE